MASNPIVQGITPYSTDGCADSNLFNANHHLDRKMQCDVIADIAWKKAVDKYIINCGEMSGDYYDIMSMFPTSTVKVNTTEYYQIYMKAVNWNISAADAVTGTANNTATLYVAPKSHLNNGKASFIGDGFTLINMDNMEIYQITAINTSVDFRHNATIRSIDNKAFSIRKGAKLHVVPGESIGKVACSTKQFTQLRDMGYAKTTHPSRFQLGWCFDEAVDGAQREVRLLDTLDIAGNRHTEWEPVVKANARINMQRRRTLEFLFGRKRTNTNDPLSTDEFSGWDGYLHTLRYGGGNYVPTSMNGITVAHLDMVEQRGRAFGITEYYWKLPWIQRRNTERNLDEHFKNKAGSCTFDTFQRVADAGDLMDATKVKKLGVTSYSQNGVTHHFSTAKWADSSNGLGVGMLEHAIFCMPSVGTRDINGMEIPTFQMLEFEGQKNSNYRYYEQDDMLKTRGPNFCERMQGVIRDTMWLKINCLTNHWWFQPTSTC